MATPGEEFDQNQYDTTKKRTDPAETKSDYKENTQDTTGSEAGTTPTTSSQASENADDM